MSTQSFSDGFDLHGLFLDFGDTELLDGPGKWRRSSRILFCATSAVVLWTIIVRLAETVIGN